MKSVIYVILVASLCNMGPAYAGNPQEFEFRGHKIGEPIEKGFPYYKQENKYNGKPYCDKGSDNQYTCPDRTAIVKDNGVESIKVGDIYIVALNYEFFNNKLYGMHMVFGPHSYDRIKLMLIGKYGPPTNDINSVVVNNYGGSFDNNKTTWIFIDGVLELEKRVSVNSSLLRFIHPQAEVEAAKRQIEKDIKSGKSAF